MALTSRATGRCERSRTTKTSTRDPSRTHACVPALSMHLRVDEWATSDRTAGYPLGGASGEKRKFGVDCIGKTDNEGWPFTIANEVVATQIGQALGLNLPTVLTHKTEVGEEWAADRVSKQGSEDGELDRGLHQVTPARGARRDHFRSFRRKQRSRLWPAAPKRVVGRSGEDAPDRSRQRLLLSEPGHGRDQSWHSSARRCREKSRGHERYGRQRQRVFPVSSRLETGGLLVRSNTSAAGFPV
jgi:hypothetical protein